MGEEIAPFSLLFLPYSLRQVPFFRLPEPCRVFKLFVNHFVYSAWQFGFDVFDYQFAVFLAVDVGFCIAEEFLFGFGGGW